MFQILQFILNKPASLTRSKKGRGREFPTQLTIVCGVRRGAAPLFEPGPGDFCKMQDYRLPPIDGLRSNPLGLEGAQPLFPQSPILARLYNRSHRLIFRTRLFKLFLKFLVAVFYFIVFHQLFSNFLTRFYQRLPVPFAYPCAKFNFTNKSIMFWSNFKGFLFR